MSKGFRYQPGDPFAVACAKKGAASGPFQPGDARASAAGRKSRAFSPWGRIPFNKNAQRTKRLALIQQIARKP